MNPCSQTSKAAIILCVDDDPCVRAALKRILRAYSCRVLGARNGVNALKLLEMYPVQVLICDEMMPGLKGHEILRRTKVLSPKTFRIMLTGHCHNPNVAMRAVNKGEIHRLLTKPWEERAIKSILADAQIAVPLEDVYESSK